MKNDDYVPYLTYSTHDNPSEDIKVLLNWNNLVLSFQLRDVYYFELIQDQGYLLSWFGDASSKDKGLKVNGREGALQIPYYWTIGFTIKYFYPKIYFPEG